MRPGIIEFDAGRIDPAQFNHAEHIRIGWLYLVSYGKADGSRRFCDALKRFTRSIGAEAKYHETITCFFLDQIGARLDGSDWAAFKAANPDLFDGKSLLDSNYSSAMIDSPRARQHYVFPDRIDRKLHF